MRAFVCPTCSATMHKAKGPWDIWYCLPCHFQWDVYSSEGPEPATVQVDSVQLHDVWEGGAIIHMPPLKD